MVGKEWTSGCPGTSFTVASILPTRCVGNFSASSSQTFMIVLQCPHQGAYHMTRLGRLVSSRTRDLWWREGGGGAETYLKFTAVRYLAGLVSQCSGRGSV